MKLFTIGPVEMYESTLNESSKQLPYFRTQEFSQIVLDIKNKLLNLANCDGDLALLTCSGTGGLEAAVLNTASSNDKYLVINGGTFGQRICNLLDIYNIQYDEISIPFGSELTYDNLKDYEKKGYTKMFCQACESSTGQLYDLNMIGSFCKKNNMMLIVDAISSFLADYIDMQNMNIDLMIVGSQKELSLAPGLCIILVSNRMKKQISINEIKSMYFNLNEYFKNMERGQTPFTVAVGIVIQLLDRLKNIKLNNEIELHKSRAEYFRKKAKEIGLEIPKYRLSNGLTPIFFREGNAKEVFEAIKNNYDMMVTPNGGKLSPYLLRVGHMGNLTFADYDNLINAFSKVKK